ncbi:unnamed protein product [Rhizoctonia solani]|uniref:Uncharacterized protein n=1 Tax=Rhizoctonia solani TaxID=456999 RepID=A0A8H3HM82_9AGAM|nr:unnamed protein product [Rhizoctonia solani]
MRAYPEVLQRDLEGVKCCAKRYIYEQIWTASSLVLVRSLPFVLLHTYTQPVFNLHSFYPVLLAPNRRSRVTENASQFRSCKCPYNHKPHESPSELLPYASRCSFECTDSCLNNDASRSTTCASTQSRCDRRRNSRTVDSALYRRRNRPCQKHDEMSAYTRFLLLI